jgi:hypothetical protein
LVVHLFMHDSAGHHLSKPYCWLHRWSASPDGGPLESLGDRVDVDIPDQTWADATSFHDVLIFNTGHW